MGISDHWGKPKTWYNNIHYEAARIITGGTKLCSHDKLLSDLGRDTLQERRTKHKLVIFYKILNNLTPPYLQDLCHHLFKRLIPIDLEILTISSQFTLTPTCIITFFIPPQYETGITYPKKLKSPAQLHHLNTNSTKIHRGEHHQNSFLLGQG